MCAAVATYTVKAGDNLWDIAAANHTSVDALRANNPKARGEYIQPGMVLELAPRVAPIPRDLPAGLRAPSIGGATDLAAAADVQVPRRDPRPAVPASDQPVAVAPLEAAPVTTAPVTTAPSGPFSRTDEAQVTGLQRDLSLLGHYQRRVDGKYGAGTESAVADYQRGNNLPLAEPDAAFVAQVHDAAARLPTEPRTTSAGALERISDERMLEYRRLGARIQADYPNTDYQRGIVPPYSAYEPLVRMAAQDTGVSEDKLRQLIFAESKGDWRAVSSADARGLVQVQDGAWSDVQRLRPWVPDYQYNVENPALNLLVGAYYWRMGGGTSAGYVRGSGVEIARHSTMMRNAPDDWTENMT